MFEGLTEDAAHALILAQHEASLAGQGEIGCGHLLVALACDRGTPAGLALEAAGLTAAGLRARIASAGPGRALDADALASVGIDLDTVRRATEAAFGPGALDRGRLPTAAPGRRRRGFGRLLGLPLNTELKRVLALALRSATGTRQPRINPGHLLLGLLGQGDNLAVAALVGAGADLDAIRADVLRRVSPAA